MTVTLSTSPAVAPEVRTLSSINHPGGNQVSGATTRRFTLESADDEELTEPREGVSGWEPFGIEPLRDLVGSAGFP